MLRPEQLATCVAIEEIEKAIVLTMASPKSLQERLSGAGDILRRFHGAKEFPLLSSEIRERLSRLEDIMTNPSSDGQCASIARDLLRAYVDVLSHCR